MQGQKDSTPALFVKSLHENYSNPPLAKKRPPRDEVF